MSYILEALKKAQAERQLGSPPTIHSAPNVPAVTQGAAERRRPLLLALGAGALIAVAAIFVWRQQPGAPASPAPRATAAHSVQVAAAPVAAPPAIAILPSKQVAAFVAEPAPARTRAPAAAHIEAAQAHMPTPASVAEPVPAQAHMPAPAPAPRQAQMAEKVREAAAPAPVGPAPAPASAEDSVGPLSSLPAAIQGQVPRVSFGGYLYSPNPADRLLLVDKALRHEGEEVAPGLVLEKLLPKAAVMNYKGYRYRVAY